ncbi:MAG: SelB C-terminal domain-containing protein, partial [Chthoniobacterales bacterium]
HHGTSRYAVRILSLEKDGVARLKLASPIFAFLGDRFVLRDASEQRTIGGGIVLDPDGDKHPTFLDAPGNADLCLRAEVASRRFVRKETLLRKSRFSADEIAAALRRLEDLHQITIRGELAVDPDAWEKLRTRAIVLIDAAHHRNPERAGLDFNQLRALLEQVRVDVFQALIADLCDGDFVRAGSAIARPTHQAGLPAALLPIENKTRVALSEKPFDPPPRRTMETDPQTRLVLRFLIENGEAIEVSEDVVLLSENFATMRAAVVDLISKNGPATVSELRQALQSSRRVMVPFLERLDRDGITRRVGEKRLLR